MMKNLLEKVNETVLELWTGILLWGIVCQLIPVWFLKEKADYSLGLWPVSYTHLDVYKRQSI